MKNDRAAYAWRYCTLTQHSMALVTTQVQGMESKVGLTLNQITAKFASEPSRR